MPLPVLRFAAIAFSLTLLTTLAYPKAKWHFAQVDGFSIYSSASAKETQKAIANFRDGRAILKMLMPNLAKEQTVPLRVIVCKGNRTLDAFAPLYNGKPKDIGGFFTQDFEGPIAVIRTDFDDDFNRHIIYHEYIHYLTRNSGINLPPWFGEGIAELFATPTKDKQGLVVVGDAPPAALFQIANRSLLPMQRLFAINFESPEYNSDQHGAGVFYAQSWAFLHYLMFGDNDLPPNSDQAIFEHVFNGKVIDEPFLQKTIGIGYEELGERLKKYCNGGRFMRRAFKLEETEEPIDYQPRPLSEAETKLMMGMLTLKTRSPQEAYPLLAEAAKALPENPTAAAYLGYHALAQDQIEYAIPELERAIELGSDSPYTYLNYARALLSQKIGEAAWQSDTLGQEETAAILSLLFKARSMAGAFDQKLYERIGETWLSSTVVPEDSHIAVLIEGIYAFPSNVQLGSYLAAHYIRVNNPKEARRIIDHYYPGPMNPAQRANFKSLLAWLDQTESSL